MAVFAILTVCTGNICRSPLAELVLRDRLCDLPSIEVMSAGTGARPSDVIPRQSAAIARSLGLDPESHRSQRVEDGMLQASDLVLAMSRDHRRAIVTAVPRVLPRSFTVREFARIADAATDEEILAATAGVTEYERLGALVRFIASRRGSAPAGVSADIDDVVDPYGRADELYQRSADELLPAVVTVARVLRIAVTDRAEARGVQAEVLL